MAAARSFLSAAAALGDGAEVHGRLRNAGIAATGYHGGKRCRAVARRFGNASSEQGVGTWCGDSACHRLLAHAPRRRISRLRGHRITVTETGRTDSPEIP